MRLECLERLSASLSSRRANGGVRRGISRVAWLAVWVVAAGYATPGCMPNVVCKVGGPINDASNRSLRRSLMSFGLGQFCAQMIARNAPLTLAPDQPVIGRFFPKHCIQQMLDNGDLWVQFDGQGYAWTDLSKKVTFASAATLRYNEDFRCADDDAIYAYFDPRTVAPPDFRVTQLEHPVANLMQSWITPFADQFGRQVLSGQLAQGFTVIENTNGTTEFSIGHLPIGQRPFHPFDVHGGGRITYESLRTQIHAGERDFIGPVTVEGNRRALYLQMRLEGVRSVEVFVVPKAEGDASLQLYMQYGTIGPLAFPPRFRDVVQYGVEYRRAVPVPAGMYYVVIDNSPTAGQAAPPAPLFGVVGDAAALVNYAIQIGDTP